MSLVDLHLHLLPGIDDGPADEAMALEHAARIAAAGVREAVVTPHVASPYFDVDVDELLDRTAALQDAIDREGIELAIRAGAELHPSGAADLRRAELEAVAQGPPGARWLLLEVPFAGVDAAFAQTCEALRGHGFGLVIAHPERAAGLLAPGGGMRVLRGELARGAVLQVNVCSLLGANGDEARDAGVRLLRGGLAYVLASDGHGGARGHSLADGVAPALAAGVGELGARRLTAANPGFLLRHGIPAVEPSPRGLDRRVERALAAGRRRPSRS
jgi:protein-tyrosine phosphatase